MTVHAKFETIQELETAFRALVIFKFGGTADADVYLGSPVMARAAETLLRSIVDYWTETGDGGRAAEWRELYRISNVRHRVDPISAYARRHPKWATLSRQERLDWLRIIAAPYRLDDAGIAYFDSLLGE